MKRKSKDIIVYNTLPDPLKSIKEYEYDSDTGRPKLVKQTLYKYDKDYKLVDKTITQYGEKVWKQKNWIRLKRSSQKFSTPTL